jgi:putative addiction module killer protein
MFKVRYYVTDRGNSPFADWFSSLDSVPRAKAASAVERMEQGNLSNVKSVGRGVLEYRIDFGPGYRIYFGRDGPMLIILLAGVNQEAATAGYRHRYAALAGLQARQTTQPMKRETERADQKLQ